MGFFLKNKLVFNKTRAQNEKQRHLITNWEVKFSSKESDRFHKLHHAGKNLICDKAFLIRFGRDTQSHTHYEVIAPRARDSGVLILQFFRLRNVTLK
jgi:hypothetical protein